MSKWFFVALGVVLGIAVIIAVAARMATDDPARWHVDPEMVTDVQTRNQYLARHAYGVPPAELANKVEEALGGRLLAGDLQDGWATYVIRTPLMGYPDYVSVRIAASGEGSRVALFSRSRFGQSDLGANRKRVERVLAAMTDLPPL